MLEKVDALDKQLLIFLNNLGSQQYDGIWIYITNQLNWWPVFLLIFYLVFKNLGWRHALLVIAMIVVLITLTDQTTNYFFKFRFERLRPGSNPEISGLIRVIRTSSTFSFISGHASNSMAAAFFLFTVLKPHVKYIGFIFLWPLIFAYSRIYLGLHYPGDILAGYIWGFLMALLVVQLYKFIKNKYYPNFNNSLDYKSVEN